MKIIIVAGILSLTGCIEDDRVRCTDLDGGLFDAGDAGCVSEEFIAFPDMVVHIERQGVRDD
tara:strand:- start:1490 stop:1675 length:186 start_codon:yes stop_codon:yes gene_type:complete